MIEKLVEAVPFLSAQVEQVTEELKGMHVLNPQFREMCLLDDQPVLQAIKRLESNRVQIAFVLDKADRLVGVVTNGDVRRFLLEGGKISQSVHLCMNRTFRSAPDDASREELLKLLDLGFNAIPRIDGNGRLIDVLTPEYLPTVPEALVLTPARAPVRISFGGAGSDLTYFFVDHPGAVLSTTISLFCHVTLIPVPTANCIFTLRISTSLSAVRVVGGSSSPIGTEQPSCRDCGCHSADLRI